MVLIRARIQSAQDETNTVALNAFCINLGRIPFLAKSFRDRSRFARMPSGERACIPVGEPYEDRSRPAESVGTGDLTPLCQTHRRKQFAASVTMPRLRLTSCSSIGQVAKSKSSHLRLTSNGMAKSVSNLRNTASP